MHRDVTLVRRLPDYEIYVETEGGQKGIFDIRPYLSKGAFRELKDINYFDQVDILFGAVTWPNEQGVAPETRLNELQLDNTRQHLLQDR